MSGRILSFTPRERKELRDPVERMWHERLLELAKLNANVVFLPHFRESMARRGITQREVDSLVKEGSIWAIDVGSDKVDLQGWAPKWILCWPDPNNWVIGGVFAYDGERLIGITIYHNDRVMSLSVLRNAA